MTRMRLSRALIALSIILVMLIGSIYAPFIPQASASDISLLSNTGYLDPAHNYHVVGEVKNVGSRTYQTITITVNFYDIDNQTVTTRFDVTMLDILLPGRRSPFDISLLDESLSSLVDHYSISITQSSRTPIPYGLQIYSDSSFLDETGAKHVVGNIKNFKDKTAENVEVVATFYNAAGNVIAASSNYIDPESSVLSPGESRSFELSIDVGSQATSYVLTAESIQYAVLSEVPPPQTPPPPPVNTYPPSITNPSPSNNSKGVKVSTKTLNVTVSDRDGDTFNLHIMTDPDVGILNLSNIRDGSFTVILSKSLNWNTTYVWKVDAEDSDYTTGNTYTFTTEPQPRPPAVSNVSPANSTQRVIVSLKTLNFTLNNPDVGPMNYYLSLEPGGFKSQALGVGDGDYDVTLPALNYGTKYVWRLSVMSSNLWTNSTYTFTTEPQPSLLDQYFNFVLIGVFIVAAIVLVVYYLRSKRIRNPMKPSTSSPK
jgi:hypothetical protein